MGILLAHMNIVSVQFDVAGIDTDYLDGAPSRSTQHVSTASNINSLAFIGAAMKTLTDTITSVA